MLVYHYEDLLGVISPTVKILTVGDCTGDGPRRTGAGLKSWNEFILTLSLLSLEIFDLCCRSPLSRT